MRTRADDAHVAHEYVPELRHLIDTQFAEPFPERVNALVAVAGLARFLIVIRAHGAEFVNLEPAILHTGPGLNMKERTGRLDPLRDPDNQGEHRENDDHHRQ